MSPQDKDYESRVDESSIHEAEKHDRALMEPIQTDMNRIILFAGAYSAGLIASLAPVLASKRLTTVSINKSIAMLNEYASLLLQTSQQRGMEDPQTVISPFPAFKPNHSDIRYQIFWLVSLGFSMAAALGAIIVQQRIRDYLQIFHLFRACSPLDRSQIRQSLFHPVVDNVRILVKYTTAFVCISICFFFIGLGNSLVVMYNAAV